MTPHMAPENGENEALVDVITTVQQEHLASIDNDGDYWGSCSCGAEMPETDTYRHIAEMVVAALPSHGDCLARMNAQAAADRLERYLTLIESERQRRPSEVLLADEIRRLRAMLSDRPACRYCGADCSTDRSWDGGDLYACHPCATARAERHARGRQARGGKGSGSTGADALRASEGSSDPTSVLLPSVLITIHGRCVACGWIVQGYHVCPPPPPDAKGAES